MFIKGHLANISKGLVKVTFLPPWQYINGSLSKPSTYLGLFSWVLYTIKMTSSLSRGISRITCYSKLYNIT